jgi:hypothetical protein
MVLRDRNNSSPICGKSRWVDSSGSRRSSAGREFTDDGRVHEDRGLKGRDRQARAHNCAARARRATRNVPIPPELVRLLREHIEMWAAAEPA